MWSGIEKNYARKPTLLKDSGNREITLGLNSFCETDIIKYQHMCKFHWHENKTVISLGSTVSSSID